MNDIKLAHDHSSKNKAELEESTQCGCFYCLAIFDPLEIEEWIDNEKTAFCPKCHIDSVIGDKSGFPIIIEFLEKMHKYWFKPTGIKA